MRDVMWSVDSDGRKVDVKQLMREEISRANTQRITNAGAPHLIKPPWKKQKDKTYRIRMTCGSILWLKISPQSRWITCRKIIFRESANPLSSSWDWARGGRHRLSQWSKLVFGETSPPPTKSRGLHTSTQRALLLQAAGQHWSVSVLVLVLKGSVGLRVCGVFFCVFFFFVTVWFFFSSCAPPPPHTHPRSKKLKKGWRFKGTVALVLMAASCVIKLN